MSISDPIADMLTMIRNAVMARHSSVLVPASGVKAEIAALLSQEGYVKGFKIIRDDKQNKIRIYLKYKGDQSAIQGIKRVSSPGRRVYTGADDIPGVLNGLGAAVLSTNRGILTDTEAREEKVGGEVICYVW